MSLLLCSSPTTSSLLGSGLNWSNWVPGYDQQYLGTYWILLIMGKYLWIILMWQERNGVLSRESVPTSFLLPIGTAFLNKYVLPTPRLPVHLRLISPSSVVVLSQNRQVAY